MGQLLHGSARTTAAVRRAIQHSQESIAKLAKRYDLNPKTDAEIHSPPLFSARLSSTNYERRSKGCATHAHGLTQRHSGKWPC
jgi:hypothetical protein